MRNEVRDFLDEIRYTKAESTVHVYEEHLRKFFRWLETQDIELDEVGFRDIRLFRNALCDEGLAPRSVNAILAAVRTFFSFLKEEGVVEENPVRYSKLSLKEPELPPDYMSDEEIEMVFSYMRENFPENVVAAFETQLATGLRISEVTSLKKEDLVVLQGGLFLKVEKGKGNKKRTVPVQDPAVARKILSLKGKNGTLFGVKPQTLQVYAFYASKATGIDFRTHRLRHTAATRMLAKGTSIDVVQVILGHSNINMTRRYACTLPETLFKLAARID
jgi:site-specific recombinase XerD